jgi:autoinducer 2 (AI-2) kinase
MFIVLDIGTGSGRAAIFDEVGYQLALAASEWRHHTDARWPGSRTFDTEKNWQLLCDCISRALDEARISPQQISAVSATGVRLGTACFDESDEVIFACTNTDTRAHEEVAEIVARGLGPKIYEIDGEWPGIGGPASQLLWLRRRQPEIFSRVERVTMLPDWALFKMCHEYSVDPSGAGTSGIFDSRKRSWSAEICRWLDVPAEMLPTVNEPGTLIGQVTRRASDETSLPEGTPVVQGGSDAACALLGSGAVSAGDWCIATGSFWNASVITDEVVIDPTYRAKILPHVVKDRWQLEGVGFYTGYAVRWFRDAFLSMGSVESNIGISGYRLLDELAETVPPGAHNLQFSLAGVMNARRWIVPPPVFLGWNLDEPGQSHLPTFYRALLESAGFQMRGTIEMLHHLVTADAREIPLCGGAAQSHLWPRIIADVLGKSLRIPQVKETAALGAAMCAGLGSGEFGNISEAVDAMVRWEAILLPADDERTTSTYDQKYREWKVVHDELLEMVKESKLRPFWMAAGIE